MRRKIVSAILCVVLFMSVQYTHSFAAGTSIAAEIKKMHPYGLIGEDYGILTIEDLMTNECQFEAEKFTGQKLNPFSYWQCFDLKNVSFFCDYTKQSRVDLNIDSIAGLRFETGQIAHEYIERRGWPLKTCLEAKKEFKKLTRNMKNICIAGQYIDTVQRNEVAGFELNWVFDKYKTKRGCRSYFHGECSLKAQIKQGCKIANGRVVDQVGD